MNEWLTVKDVMNILKVSRTAVNNWMASGKLKYYKAGRLVRIKREDLRKFMGENNRD